jgi:hypothetical protein
VFLCDIINCISGLVTFVAINSYSLLRRQLCWVPKRRNFVKRRNNATFIIAAERSEAAPYSWLSMTFLLFRAQSPAELYWGNSTESMSVRRMPRFFGNCRQLEHSTTVCFYSILIRFYLFCIGLAWFFSGFNTV